MTIAATERLFNAGWFLAECGCCWRSPWHFLDNDNNPELWDTDEALEALKKLERYDYSE